MLVLITKADHASFKKRIIDTLVGSGTAKSAEIPDHHGCRLGKWYDAITDQSIRALPAFKAVEGPHQRVHAAGKKALQHHENNDFVDALAEAKNLDQASKEVIALLDKLHDEVEHELRKDEIKE